MSTIMVLYKLIQSHKKELKFPVDCLQIAQSKVSPCSFDSIEESILKLSIKTCRLWLYMLTCVSILGVDFKIFPRYYAKTENYGVSAMDLGVGFYIVCHSMKIIRNTDNSSIKESNHESLSDRIKDLPRAMFKTIKSSSILLTIGILRLVSLKATNYVEHESEYGKHWNFLFTIVLVKVN